MKYLFYTLEWAAEIFLIIVHFPLYLANKFFPLKSANHRHTKKYPIILVERWFRHNVLHGIPKWYLEKKGFKVYTINCSLAHGSFEKAASELHKFIHSKKLENVVLVGISAGTLTCMEYLQKQNGWKKTKAFISIGGPFYGSPLAWVLSFIPAVQEILPSSSFLKNLYKDKIQHLEKIYSFHASSDNLVPKKFSILKGSHQVLIDVVGHNFLHTVFLPTYKKIAEITDSF